MLIRVIKLFSISAVFLVRRCVLLLTQKQNRAESHAVMREKNIVTPSGINPPTLGVTGNLMPLAALPTNREGGRDRERETETEGARE